MCVHDKKERESRLVSGAGAEVSIKQDIIRVSLRFSADLAWKISALETRSTQRSSNNKHMLAILNNTDYSFSQVAEEQRLYLLGS